MGLSWPGIAARLKLLFDDVQTEVKKKDNPMDSMDKKGVVVMDRVREMDKTVLVKRRARNGQTKESGIRMARIDLLFGGSQAQKRKDFENEGPSKEKRRKFGE